MVNIKFGNYNPPDDEASDNDFIPIISLDFSFASMGDYNKNVRKYEIATLSEHIDSGLRNQKTGIVTITIPSILR